MEFRRPIFDKIELICQQIAGIQGVASEPERQDMVVGQLMEWSGAAPTASSFST